MSSFFKNFGYLPEPCIEEIWRIFLNFGQNMAIENLKENLILALLIFNTALWLYITTTKKKKKGLP
jgi:hypothetical protein